MQKDPYLILGLAKGASEDEVKKAYLALRDKYAEDRFLEGEAGATATRKLAEVDQAFKDCMDDIRQTKTGGQPVSLYGGVESDIRAGRYDDAQRKLDDIDMRDAEWHYYQSMVYFKKGWHSESKAQLEICIALEPYNEKYNSALNKMNDYLKNKTPFKENQPQQSNNSSQNAGQQQQQQQNTEQRAGYSDRPTSADANANACCDTCCTMMCCDSCCECMGGDLIPCC